MKLLIFGDVHGCWGDLNIAIARGLRKHPDTVAMVQVGDFSYHWPGSKPFKISKAFFDKSLYELAVSLPFHFIDGNHENHDALDKEQGSFQPNMIYQPRGSVVNFPCKAGHLARRYRRAMFFGGASSWDKDERIIGKSWWPQESIKYAQVLSALEQQGPIDICFSHEHPLAFPYSERRYDTIFGTGDKQGLDAIRERFKPRFWVFGHHHYYDMGETEGTTWVCAPVIGEKDHGNSAERQQQYIVFDGERLYLDE